MKELIDASSHRSLFLDNERYKNILQEVKEAQMLRKNNQPLKKHYRCLKRNDVMKIGDTQVLTESGSGENDDSNIRYYCKTEELFDVLETAHVNIGHKRTTGKRNSFVCDSQKHSLYLFLSRFLFLFFSHGSWTEKVVLQHYSTSDRSLFGTLWTVSIEEKDTETGISCTLNPFTIYEFSVLGTLECYAVWT